MQTKTIPILSLLAVAWFSGCSTTPKNQLSPNAWLAYTSFQQTLEKDPQTTDFERYLASDWLEWFGSADSGELEQLKHYAAYPVWLSVVHAHYEGRIKDDYCLSVNGIAFDGSPGTVSVRYIVEDDRIKASEIHYQYWELETEFPKKVLCPDDFSLDFPE